MATAGAGIGARTVPPAWELGYSGGMNGYLRLVVVCALLGAFQNGYAADAKSRKGVTETPAPTQVEFVTTVDVDTRGGVAVAPTAEQAEQAYQAARQNYIAVASGGGDVAAVAPSGTVVLEDNVAGGLPRNIALEDIRIVMDVDNVSLREVMQKIVQQAAAYSGPWTVKWRLKPENMNLLEERVNLTAEADFGEFTSLLAERVKNMTGTQLYVTAFGGSRVLLVADTYY